MCDVESTSKNAGQSVSVYTCDQQLYRVALDIVWTNPQRWASFYPRIGGMHWLMSFVGCVGKLMSGSGLDKLMQTSFAGVEKMLIGKKFPMNMRALRFVVFELLYGLIDEVRSYEDFLLFLDELSAKSLLAEHWVKNLIKPVLLMMLYVRAEREGEFALHYYACKEMLPYFFAASHWNYARDGVTYVRMMERLPNTILEACMKGEHVIHLQQGLWNGIWSDMGIESTYMKIGKGPSGIIGVTTNERTVKIWSNSHHLCGELLTELEDLRTSTANKDGKHKEEGQGRIKGDMEDRLKLRNALATYIHPLQIETHSANVLVNIYNGEEAGENVNVNKSFEIGMNYMNEFQEKLPEGFREKMSTRVVTMAEGKKKKEANATIQVKDYNTELIMSRVLYLLGNNQLDFSTLFNYELAPVPTSLFKDSGDARYPKTKSVLKNKLKVEVSLRGIAPDVVIVDGGGMLHSSIHWPKDGKVEDLVNGVEQYVNKLINTSDVCIIFDRYFEKSIKSDTRRQRVEAFKRTHHLGINTPLPAKEICMSSTKTKENLIEIIASTLLERFTKKKIQHKLIVTSKDVYPEETHQGIRTKRQDLKTHFDEADYIIPQQVNSAIEHSQKVVKVISADTDVFALLCSHYKYNNWSGAEVYLEDFQAEKNIISIKKTVDKHKDIVPSLIALHAISGCDSVPAMFRIGKAKALSVVQKFPLKFIGRLDASEDDVIREGKTFVSKAYGMK